MSVQSICGVILVADDVEALKSFYADGLGLQFDREEHGGLAVHYGLDIGAIHFAIHPPHNFDGQTSRGTAIAFQVDAIDHHLPALLDLGATLVSPRRDQGFGDVVTLKDPCGHVFELVELSHDFEG